MNGKKIGVFLLFFFASLFAKEVGSGFDLFDTTGNEIVFPAGDSSFRPLFQKLDTLVFEGRGKVRILHIGGSHIQADVFSGRFRENLSTVYPGVASDRGFVFPYSAARTNTPSSYASSYKGKWERSLNVHREVTRPLGAMGIAVTTDDPRAEFTIALNRAGALPVWSYNKVRLFGFSEGEVEPVILLDSSEIRGEKDEASGSIVYKIPRMADSLCVRMVWKDSSLQARTLKMVLDSIFRDSLVSLLPDSVRLSLDSIELPSIDSLQILLGNTPLKDFLSEEKSKSAKLDVSSKENPADDSTARFVDSLLAADLADIEAEQGEKNSENNLSEDDLNETTLKVDSDSTNASTVLKSLSETRKENAPEKSETARPKFTLTGILLENDFSGISYTSIGINGARVPSYLETPCPNFEKELLFYQPDLIILSIGINDANGERFDEANFRANYDSLLLRLRRVAPSAAILFTTNNDSFRCKKKRKRCKYLEHPNGALARDAFFKLAEVHRAGVWDLFSLMGGLGAMADWERAGLAKKDKVHFTHSGYVFLGDMLYRAFLKSYYRHIASLPAEEPVSPNQKEAK